MVRYFLGNNRGSIDFGRKRGRTRRRRAWNVVPLPLMWAVWTERNRRGFEWVESSFSQLQSSLQSLIFFWCIHRVPNCIKDLMEIVENNFFLKILNLLA